MTSDWRFIPIIRNQTATLMAKYDPLHAHLKRQTAAIYEMSFRDIERVLALLLPASAQRAEWWTNEANSDSSHVQCKAWLSAGYKAFLKGHERVRFERMGSA
jgi:hypothetical protein